MSAAAPSAKRSLLIVDDDPLIIDSLSFALERDFAVRTAASRPEAIARLHEQAAADLALIDLGLPPTPHRPDEGYVLIRELLARWPAMRIVVLTGQGGEDNARHARALGACDFVVKPASPDVLRQALVKAGASEEALTRKGADADLIGDSAPMRRLRLQIRQYAPSTYPVLVDGESGVGKELVAANLHWLSPRRDAPWLAVNCAALAPSLIEPTLFGHTRGAYTGAAAARAGYFEDAANGTLLLDEIGELPLELQAKLLRVLENGAYQRVGETQERIARCRVVATTNRDLKQEVRNGRFRLDLYHRLTVFAITVPPLRERDQDRLLLLEHFQRHAATRLELDEEARRLWLAYSFPGNVRELRNIVIRLAARHSLADKALGAADLAVELDAGASEETGALAVDSATALLPQALARLTAAAGEFNLDAALTEWEAAYIAAAQQLAQGNMSQTARLLGINRSTLYNRLENHRQPHHERETH